jgi:CDP-4-dehydro-6-deoxyglucose reductase, E3
MREMVLTRADTLSPTVRGLSLACADGLPLPYVPGQWLNVHVQVASGALEKRAYSIASAPHTEHPERVELAVTRVEGGAVSEALHVLSVGARLQVDGPHGFFTREGAEGQDALLVGTGTGVCPLRAMLASELARPEGPQVTLLFGCRTEADILYREEFEALAARVPRFSLHVTLSRPSTGWRGLTGHVQTHLTGLISKASKPHVYVCGLSRMVGEVRRVLKDEHGYDRKLIHSERYD